MQQLSVSFIIPAYNEELFLPHVLKNISRYMSTEFFYEVIVADNGSEDKTVELAKEAGAKVIVDHYATIGGLRNLAVKSSKGNVLIFLDADILLTDIWRKNFISTYKSLLANPYIVTGSRCAIPTPASWVEKTWFKPLLTQTSKYINSGHLITSRKLFDRIGGFDSNLETGEDYAFGKSALLANATIVNNPLLEVVHEGYPKSLRHFIKREIWHGRGDCESLKELFSSNVALASLIFFFLHLILLLGIINASYLVSIALFLLIISMCLSAAVLKHRARKVHNIVQVGFLYYLYFGSRLLSCIPFLNKRSHR